MEERARYDEKLTRILKAAAGIFAEKGYHQASIRDLASETGVSLSGLYYYFDSKEELLYLIQDHCFGTILDRASAAVSTVDAPEEKLRIFVQSHLSFFANNMPEMKVLSREADILTGEYRAGVQHKKREYVGLVEGILSGLLPVDSSLRIRTATFTLFGMMNWIYTWYRPAVDAPVEDLGEEMLHIFCHGLTTPRKPDRGATPPVEGTAAGPFWPETSSTP